MGMLKKNLLFPYELMERLEKEKARTGAAWAEIVRRAVNEYLTKVEASINADPSK